MKLSFKEELLVGSALRIARKERRQMAGQWSDMIRRRRLRGDYDTFECLRIPALLEDLRRFRREHSEMIALHNKIKNS